MTKFLNISTDNTLGGNSPSDETVSSQKAIKAYVDNNSGGLPSQTGNAGKFLTTDGTSASWATVSGSGANTDLSNLTSTGKVNSATFPMPSSSYTDLTLGATGATYTATDNGYFFLEGTVIYGNGYTSIFANNMVVGGQNATATGYVWMIMPVKKGDVAQVDYNSFNLLYFRFIKSQGDV